MEKKPKKMGRPCAGEKAYRKVMRRFSAYEDAILPVVEQFESKRDKELILKALEAFQQA